MNIPLHYASQAFLNSDAAENKLDAQLYREDSYRVLITPVLNQNARIANLLSIVQWIVQAHGGEVRVESKIGAGSLFEVRLPLLNRAEE